ncbi:MAG: hypothetical protein PWP44_1090, partial [Thermacetogenium sp.]|nr:hypothetical protein [Thermacetogenium sp.]
MSQETCPGTRHGKPPREQGVALLTPTKRGLKEDLRSGAQDRSFSCTPNPDEKGTESYSAKPSRKLQDRCTPNPDEKGTERLLPEDLTFRILPCCTPNPDEKGTERQIRDPHL